MSPEIAYKKLDRPAITAIAVEALFIVWESDTTPTAASTVGKAYRRTGQEYPACSGVINRLIEQSYLMITEESARDTLPQIAFGTAGLWLLEDAFGHGEENIDSMTLAERILETNHFFD